MPVPVPAQILLVDDNEMGLTARKTLLEEQGYSVTMATSGEAALEMLRRRPFDLVITDFRMPGMNGIELIRQIREERPQIPVILLSGFVQSLGLNEQATGADAVLAKSANEVTQLLRTVAKLLRRKRRKPSGSQGPARQVLGSRASGA